MSIALRSRRGPVGTAWHAIALRDGAERLLGPARVGRGKADARAGRVHVYACGPQRMIDDLTAGSTDWPEGAVAFEHFSSTLGELDPEQEHEFTVHLEDSDVDLVVPRDKTLLQTLRESGRDVPSNCEEGLCGTCEVPVLEGDIDHRDVVLTPAERRDGDRMMSCCSRADGTRITLGL